MEAFTTHTGRAVPLRRSNVDTDQIIPAVWLKRVSRTGFEEGLFAAWREDPDFVLNQPAVRGRDDAGRRPRLRHRLVPRARRLGAAAVRLPRGHLAPRFGDIFRNNATKNGLLPVGPRRGRGRAPPGRRSRRTRPWRSPSTWRTRGALADGVTAAFEIDDYTRWRLLEGLDDIGLTLRHGDAISDVRGEPPELAPHHRLRRAGRLTIRTGRGQGPSGPWPPSACPRNSRTPVTAVNRATTSGARSRPEAGPEPAREPIAQRAAEAGRERCGDPAQCSTVEGRQGPKEESAVMKDARRPPWTGTAVGRPRTDLARAEAAGRAPRGGAAASRGRQRLIRQLLAITDLAKRDAALAARQAETFLADLRAPDVG